MQGLLRRLHRWFGLVLALLLIISGLTSSVIAFEPELDAWLNPALFVTSGRGRAQEPGELVARIETADPSLLVTLLPLDA